MTWQLVADSIYYPEAKVSMERWREGEFRERFEFLETDSIPREQGIFASNPNRVFASSNKLDGASEYRLEIVIPGKEDTIRARTSLVDQDPDNKTAFLPSQLLTFHNTMVNWRWNGNRLPTPGCTFYR